MSLLERFASGERVRVAVSMPPQSGKTSFALRVVDRYLTANPEETCVYATYNFDRVEYLKRRLPDYGGRLGLTAVRGSMPIRGNGLLVVDDCYKDRVEAMSHDVRHYIRDWFIENFWSSRGSDGTSSGLVIGSRWHHEDLHDLVCWMGWEEVELPGGFIRLDCSQGWDLSVLRELARQRLEGA